MAMVLENDAFLKSIREGWVSAELEARKAELGPLFPKVIGPVNRFVEWMEYPQLQADDANLLGIVADIRREGLPVVKVLKLSAQVHTEWQNHFANDRFSPQPQ